MHRRQFIAFGVVLPLAACHAVLRDDPPLIVTGTLNYRQRIALPPDAAAIVQLVDISRKAPGGVMVAQQIVAPLGQVPIPFTLRFDHNDLPRQADLTIVARIQAGPRLLFVNTLRTRVRPADLGRPFEIWLDPAG